MSAPSRPGSGPPENPSGGEPVRPRRAGLLAITAAGLFAADVLSKVLVVANLMDRDPVRLLGGALYLTHARNPGAAFSFAEGATVLFTAVAAVVVAVIVRTASRLRSTPWAVCLGLILGGAAGNLADRLFRSPAPLRGHVVDWISAFDPYGRVYPIFNFADSGIVIGGALAVLLAALGYEMDGTRSGRAVAGRGAGRRRRRARSGPDAGPDPGRAPAGPDGGPGPAARYATPGPAATSPRPDRRPTLPASGPADPADRGGPEWPVTPPARP